MSREKITEDLFRMILTLSDTRISMLRGITKENVPQEVLSLLKMEDEGNKRKMNNLRI